MNIFSNNLDILRKKVNETKKQTPLMKTVNIKQLVENTPLTVKKDSPILNELGTNDELNIKSTSMPNPNPNPTLDSNDEFIQPDTSNSNSKSTQHTFEPDETVKVDSTHSLQFDVSYLHLVLIDKHTATLVKQNHMYTFPIIGYSIPTTKQYKEIINHHQLTNPTMIVEPALHSAYIVDESSSYKGELKSDIVQRHRVGSYKVHPSVWGFFNLYPEYFGTDVVYRMRQLTNHPDYSIPMILRELVDQHSAFIMEDDAIRFNLDNEHVVERQLGIVGYIEPSFMFRSLQKKMNRFIKQYNTIQHLCIRIRIKTQILPVWIQIT